MEPGTRRAKVVRFGTFEADIEGLRLRNNGQTVNIQEQPFRILAALLERPGEIVTREELRQRIWPDVVVDYEHSLRTSILKLRQALGDSTNHPRYVETVPRHGYRLVCPVERLDAQILARGRGWRGPVAWLAGVAVVAAIATGIYAVLPRDRVVRPVPLTSLAGPEWYPGISPDGKLVAFSWGERTDKQGAPGMADLYLQRIDDGKLVRLTDNPADEFSPTWSPDSLRIAFCRRSPAGGSTIHVIDAWSKHERMIGQSMEGGSPWLLRRLAWSPNGEFLAVADKESPQGPESIVLLSIRTGAKRKLTTPSRTAMDRGPAFSPDGRTLAYIRASDGMAGPCEIYLLPLNADGVPAGEPRRLLSDERTIHGLDWTADGRNIVFSAAGPGVFHSLWEIPVSGGKRVQLNAGYNAYDPSISRTGDRLVYVRRVLDPNIWRVPRAKSTPGGGVSAERLIDSTGTDCAPKYSPDGGKIAFVSSRSGGSEIYVCDGDGSNQEQLTSLGESRRRFGDSESGGSGEPSWSPDGRQIAFAGRVAGNQDIYVVNAEGGRARRLTRHPAEDASPNWSNNGEWIYFRSNRSGEWQIWRMSSKGELAGQVTKHGGYEAHESADGRFLYYMKQSPPSAIWRVPLAGGEETQALDGEEYSHWARWKDGICLLDRGSVSAHFVKFFRFASGKIEDFAELPRRGPLDDGLTVSRDGRWVLYSQMDTFESDVMLMENFR